MAINRTEAVATFKRLFVNGPLDAWPRPGRDLDLLLALAAARIGRGSGYRERDLNERLKPWLAGFCGPHGPDHVTVRRFLVDMGFLVRDTAGSSYAAGARSPGEILDAAAFDIEPAQVLAELTEARAQRKRERAA